MTLKNIIIDLVFQNFRGNMTNSSYFMCDLLPKQRENEMNKIKVEFHH